MAAASCRSHILSHQFTVVRPLGVNRSRGEAAETIHDLFIARLKDYISEENWKSCKSRYKECIRMLNGLEKTLEKKLPEKEQRWILREEAASYDSENDTCPTGWPSESET